jgi:2-oxoglutarate ferredoxin oxidoreductase subunit alpha
MASLTIKGFDLADKYLMTAMILADGTIGQMMEPITFEDAEIKTYEKPWALTGTEGKRKHNIVNSLYLKPEELEKKNFERFEKYAEIERSEAMWEDYMMEDAEIAVVAFGIASRVAKNAVAAARKEGIKVGLIRPITLWPFPTAPFKKALDTAKAFVSVELSMGQMIEDVRLATECKKPVSLCCRTGGMIPSPDEVLEAIHNAVKGEA